MDIQQVIKYILLDAGVDCSNYSEVMFRAFLQEHADKIGIYLLDELYQEVESPKAMFQEFLNTELQEYLNEIIPF